MRDDAMERLGRENPVPGALSGPPIEPLLRVLDEESPELDGRSPVLRRARRLLRRWRSRSLQWR